MNFAKIVFWIAAIWGVVIIVPLYFLITQATHQAAPGAVVAESYYGFVTVALAWQIAFFVIALDPQRYRGLMIPAIFEKLGYVTLLLILHAQGRLDPARLPFIATDFLLGVLFVIAFFKSKRRRAY
jgi:hypothetical protein